MPCNWEHCNIKKNKYLTEKVYIHVQFRKNRKWLFNKPILRLSTVSEETAWSDCSHHAGLYICNHQWVYGICWSPSQWCSRHSSGESNQNEGATFSDDIPYILVYNPTSCIVWPDYFCMNFKPSKKKIPVYSATTYFWHKTCTLVYTVMSWELSLQYLTS